MLWVLKRTVSMRRFFWAPKQMLKLNGREIFTILCSKILLILTNANSLHASHHTSAYKLSQTVWTGHHDQARQNVGPDLDPNCLTHWWYSWNASNNTSAYKLSQTVWTGNYDQAQQNDGPDLDPNCMTHWWYAWNYIIFCWYYIFEMVIIILDWVHNLLYTHSVFFFSCGFSSNFSRGLGFKPHLRHCVVSLSKAHLSLLSTGSTQEDPSRHNWKIVDWDVKNQIKQTKKSINY